MRILLAAATLSCCCRTPAPPAPAPETPPVADEPNADRPLPRVPGVAVMNGQETCVSFGDVNGAGVETELPVGTELLIIIPGETRGVIVEATVRGTCADDGSGRRRHAIDIGYREPFVGIAVVGRLDVRIPGTPEQTNSITADVDRDGTYETFRSCASSEGVHLTIWTGSVRRWHAYHYLGYDTEPTCTEAETRP